MDRQAPFEAEHRGGLGGGEVAPTVRLFGRRARQGTRAPGRTRGLAPPQSRSRVPERWTTVPLCSVAHRGPAARIDHGAEVLPVVHRVLPVPRHAGGRLVVLVEHVDRLAGRLGVRVERVGEFRAPWRWCRRGAPYRRRAGGPSSTLRGWRRSGPTRRRPSPTVHMMMMWVLPMFDMPSPLVRAGTTGRRSPSPRGRHRPRLYADRVTSPVRVNGGVSVRPQPARGSPRGYRGSRPRGCAEAPIDPTSRRRALQSRTGRAAARPRPATGSRGPAARAVLQGAVFDQSAGHRGRRRPPHCLSPGRPRRSVAAR